MVVVEAPRVCHAKLIVAGESAVGKSSIVKVLANDVSHFSQNYERTAGIDLLEKAIGLNAQTGDTVHMLLVDSSGADLYEPMLRSCWPPQSLPVLVYDTTRKATFDSLDKWREKLLPFLARDATGLLIANKCDLVGRRFVSESAGQAYAQKHKLTYFECSAKENIDIQDAFRSLATQWHRSVFS